MSVQAKHLSQDGSLKGKQAHFQVDERATFLGSTEQEETLSLKAKELILHTAHLRAWFTDLNAKTMTATESSLAADVASVDVSGGKADLQGLTVTAKDIFSLKADEAKVNPELITTALANFYLQTYEDGINGIMKLAHELVLCDKVCFDARKEALVIDKPTKWRPNIALALAKVVLKESVTSNGTIELISETGIEVLKSVIAESIFLQAKTEDILLRDALLKAVQDIHLQADERSVKGTASKLKTDKRDIALRAGTNIELASTAHRTGDGQNYKDEKDQAQASAGGTLTLNAEGEIRFTGVQTKSVKGTTLQAGQNIIDAPLSLATQTESGSGKNFKQEKVIHQDVSQHQTDGTFVSKAGGSQELFAPEIKAKKINIVGQSGVNFHEVHDTHEHESKSHKKGGIFGRTKTVQRSSFDARSRGAQLVGAEPTEITSGGDINLTNVTSTAPKTVLKAVTGIVKILLGTNHSSSSKTQSSTNVAWQKQSSRVEEHRDYSPSTITGTLEIHSKETILQSVKGQTLEFLDQIEQQGGKITHTTLDEFHRVKKQSSQGPTQALAAVVALAVSICTAGAGSALGGMITTAGGLTTTSAAGVVTLTTTGTVVSSMTAAAFTSVCSQAALALLSNEGNVLKAAKSLASSDTLKSMGISVMTAGLTAGIGDKLGIETSASKLAAITKVDMSAGITAHLRANLLKGAISGGMGIALGGENLDEALMQGLRGLAAGVIGGVGANKLGEAYNINTQDIDAVSHKLLHAFLGGVTGGILAKDIAKGALAGAIGALVAETVADLLAPDKPSLIKKIEAARKAKGSDLSYQEVESLSRPELDIYANKADIAADLSKIIAATSALLTKQDVNIAIGTATNAIENNFLPAVFWVGMTAWKIYSVYAICERLVEAYNNNDKEAAAKIILLDVIPTVLAGTKIGPAFDAIGVADEIYASYQQNGIEGAVMSLMVNGTRMIQGKGVKGNKANHNIPQKPGADKHGIPPKSENIEALDLAGTTKQLSKESSLTIRPGQEWKLKIQGNAQKTKTPGHALESAKQAIRDAKDPEIGAVYLNNGYHKALRAHGIDTKLESNRLPDVLAVSKDGKKMRATEIQSKSDIEDVLRGRNLKVRDQLKPNDVTLEVDVKKIPTWDYKKGMPK